MAKRSKFLVVAVPVFFTLLVFFQNCGSQFQVAKLASESGIALSELGNADVPLEITNETGASVSQSSDLIVDKEYMVRVQGVRVPADALVKWSATSTGQVHIHAGSVPTEQALHCESPGIISLSLMISTGNKTYSSRNISLSCVVGAGATPVPTPEPGATMVTFRIPAGTGRNAWNTPATAVKVVVGQTLRIINDDSTPHRLHTNGAPCGHQPANSLTGGFYDCPVTAAISPDNTGTYDHNIGTAARFYVSAIDGRALYATNCQSCHGALASSAVRNESAAVIRNAINSVNVMKGITLSDEQLAAIAYSLSH